MEKKLEYYLDKLIAFSNEIRTNYSYEEIDESKYEKKYLLTKNTSFIGFKQGYSDLICRKKYSIQEISTLNKKSKNYLEILKQEENIKQIKEYRNGVVDVIYQCYKNKDSIYLIPFSSQGKFYPTYVYVTKFKNNEIIEEYMVEGNQIIFESYKHKISLFGSRNKMLKYYMVNYVKNGKYPILEERKGIIDVNELCFKENVQTQCWLNK